MKQFFRQLKYTAILMVRSKTGMFWTVLYPVILSSLFFAAFSSIINPKQENFEKINIGIKATGSIEQVLLKSGAFNIQHMDADEAGIKKALADKEIIAFVKEDLSLIVGSNGIKESITKNILDYTKQIAVLGMPFSNEDFQKQYVKNLNQKNNQFMILFYSLLAMVSIYGIFGGITTSIIMQANMSKLGMRISATPLNRFAAYFAAIIFYIGFNLLSNILYIAFVLFVLKINFITDFSTTILLLLFANCFGVSLGICIGSLPLSNENIKSMFAVFINLFFAFLSGMMGPGIKNAIDDKFPIVNKINPIGMLTDNFYNVNILQEYNLVLSFLIFAGISVLIFLSIIFLNSKKVRFKALN